MFWDPVRKTTTIVHVAYDHTTATLFAEDIRVRAGDPFDISIDLNKNLRTRHKSVGTYVDAKALAAGEIGTLQSVQLDDDQVYERIGRLIDRLDSVPATWRLHVWLQGSHWFTVCPEARGQHSLIFHVSSTASVPPLEAPHRQR
jgi:hypothetical protein